ncbi:MAG TPA: hypothetical protein VNL91_09465 [Thermoanaerobaculia bacterium]|nr:hypothetical protein [Thermoanaerobaculia bacterium]
MKRTFFLLALALASCATPDGGAPRSAPTSYRADETPLPVGVIPNAVLRDESRGRDLQLVIEYPIKGGPYPVIVFSHGFGGTNLAYAGITSYWAGHGFVTIRPMHADAGSITKIADLETIWQRIGPKEQRDRVRDVVFVLDSLGTLEEKYPELKGKIDAARIGVGGHSLGALTAMQIGGVNAAGAGDLRDSRVRAVVAMSPQPPGLAGLTRESFAPLRIPAMFMTGTGDRLANGESPEARKEAFDLSAPGDKYFISIEGARHMSFTGRFADLTEELEQRPAADFDPPSTPDFRRPRAPVTQETSQDARRPFTPERERWILATIKIASAGFWEAYLKDDAKAKEFLSSYLETLNGGKLEVLRK